MSADAQAFYLQSPRVVRNSLVKKVMSIFHTHFLRTLCYCVENTTVYLNTPWNKIRNTKDFLAEILHRSFSVLTFISQGFGSLRTVPGISSIKHEIFSNSSTGFPCFIRGLCPMATKRKHSSNNELQARASATFS